MVYPSIVTHQSIGKCEKCGIKSYALVNNKPLCLKHYIEDWGRSKECMETYLDMLCGDLMQGKKLSSNEKKLLKEIKKQFPKMAEEFPRIFKKIK